MIVSIERENAPYVRFGLRADAGHYQALRFSPSLAPLTSTLVPKTRGVDPFGDFGERVRVLVQRLVDGLINPDEDDRILTQRILAFEQGMPSRGRQIPLPERAAWRKLAPWTL